METKTFKSQEDNVEITYYSWKVKNPKGAVQIVHGSIEWAARYKDMALALNKAGYSVFAMDIRGHGETGKKDQLGHLADHDGFNLVLKDVHQLNDIIQKNGSGDKLILLGHSMGSFIVRAYATKYNDIDYLIPIGTNHKPKLLIKLMSAISKHNSRKKARLPGTFLNNLSYKAFSKKFKGEEKLAWLSLNEKNRREYEKSEYTGFVMTNKSFLDFARWMKMFTSKKEVSKMDKKLKILFLNGTHDPVGSMGKEPKKANSLYKKLGYQSSHKEYTNLRHEIHNEDDKQKVFKDIIEFISK